MTDASKPETGELAPIFSAPRDGGDVISLDDFAGKIVILYFYPKDDTPGCTKQAIAFSDLIDDFDAAGAVIIGVSRDTTKKHEKFRDKHDLKVALISDEEGSITEAYGVWVEKSMYGKKYMGIERTTFLIDANRQISKVWHKVKVPGHVEEVLETVKKMS